MDNRLNILWTSEDVRTAHFMVFMYGINAKTKGWWEEVRIIIWGSSTKLVAEDHTIQSKIEMALASGVQVSACFACATQFGVVEELQALGIEVIYWGIPLTELIKSREHLITV